MGAVCPGKVLDLGILPPRLVVGVGELGTSADTTALVVTYSLGSCLGITAYDPVTRVGGLLHAMLPDSSLNPDKARQRPALFVDTGMEALMQAVAALGADLRRLDICVAGGAQLMDEGALFNIGQRNHSAFLAVLRRYHLALRAEHLGGMLSRTMMLEMASGTVRLKIGGTAAEVVLFRR